MNAQDLAVLFHDTYERLAPSFGYETRTDTRKFDPTTPNGRLMIAVCGEVLATLRPTAIETARDALVDAAVEWQYQAQPEDDHDHPEAVLYRAVDAYLAALERAK